jgi:hypothetical protein
VKVDLAALDRVTPVSRQEVDLEGRHGASVDFSKVTSRLGCAVVSLARGRPRRGHEMVL